jgi:glycine/D-amino acid oxidase-like deaminating enzyme
MPSHQRALYRHLMLEQVETLIVGGGQAGLATGYHLARLGQSFLILDANERTGDSWRKRWDSLRLFTPAYLSSLPGLDFPGLRSHCPTRNEIADYLEAYAAQFDLPIRRGLSVDSVSKANDHFMISAGDRHFEAKNVVLATGAYQAPYVPNFAAQLDLASHSSTRVSTEGHPSWQTAMCWWSERPTRVLRSRSKSLPPIGPGSQGAIRAANRPDRAAGWTDF